MSELPMSAEERLAALERKVNMMWNGGGDLLGTEGYLQIGNTTTQGAQRFDREGHQIVNNTSVDAPGVYIVPFMRPDPDSATPYAVLEGAANVVAGNEDVAGIAIRAQAESTISATVGAQTFNVSDGVSTARLATVAGTLSASALLGAAHNAALATFTLDNASLVFDSFASDPASLTAGMAWFNSSDAVLRYYDGSNTIDLTGGGGGMPTPITMSPQSLLAIGSQIAANATAAAASGTFPASNRAILYPFDVTEDITVTQLWSYNGATASGNIDVGIYDSAFARVISSGTTAQSGTNALQVFNVTDTPLSAGQYYMAVAMDNTTGTLFRQQFAANHMRAAGCFQMASAFVLPTTITPAAVATAYLPMVGWTQKATI